MLKSLIVSLALTLLLEELFALAWGLRGRRELTLVALVNCLTNPAAVLLYRTVVHRLAVPAPLTALALEAAVVGTEWLLFRRGSEKLCRPFLFALLCNAFSFGMGLVLKSVL